MVELRLFLFYNYVIDERLFMTRINVVPVEELESMHLLAEYRELPRIFQLSKNYHASGKKEKLPEVYTLGKGHVKFFYDKLLWLANRQEEILKELIKRGYSPQFTNPQELLKDCPTQLCGNYEITQEALEINRQRIALRLKEYRERQEQKNKKK